jgi:hypothetical protein
MITPLSATEAAIVPDEAVIPKIAVENIDD